MGHDVVISPTADAAAVSAAGIKAGAPARFVPRNEAPVIRRHAGDRRGAGTKAKFPGGK